MIPVVLVWMRLRLGVFLYKSLSEAGSTGNLKGLEPRCDLEIVHFHVGDHGNSDQHQLEGERRKKTAFASEPTELH